MTRRAISSLLSLSAAIACMCGGAANAQQVGTAAAVNPASMARELSGDTRTIVLGQSIAHKERIQTTAAGSVQLLFLDKTSMTIGPNSDVSIDEYVYDPQANSGKLAATLAKGAMRFVGGQISHSGEATIKTATAVVGIRGGVSILTNANVYLAYGQANVDAGGGSVTLQAGEYTSTSPGALPSPPGPPPPQFIANFVKLFQSTVGQTGGTSRGAASQGNVADAEQRATGSSGTPVSGTLPTGPIFTPPTTQVVTSQVNQSLGTSSQQAFVNTLPPPGSQNTAAAAVAFNVTNCCSASNPTSSMPFLPAIFAPSGNSYISPMVGYRLNGSDKTAFLQYGISINGHDYDQSSWAFVNIGKFTADSSGKAVTSGTFVGTASYSPTSIGAFAIGNDSSPPGAVTVDSNNLPLSGTMTNNGYNSSTQTYSTNPALYATGPGIQPTPYTFDQKFQQIPTPTGLGNMRPAATLNGWIGGLMSTYDNTANTFQGTPAPLFGAASIILDPTKSRMQANFVFTNSTNFMQYQFGSVDPNQSGSSAYIDYDNFAALTQYNNNGTPMSTTNGQAMQAHAGAVLNTPASVVQQIASGLPGQEHPTFCECEYTRWGFWASQGLRTDSNGHSVTDIVHLGTWVAGQLPQIGDVPTTGIATYTGHVIGSVSDGVSQHIDAGNFANTVNFAARTGNVAVTNFDGTNYNGTTMASNDPRAFAGVLTGSGGRYMALAGSFFKGPTNPVGEMGGNFTVVGTRYIGSGIFAAAAH